jgi:hypothetical protein
MEITAPTRQEFTASVFALLSSAVRMPWIRRNFVAGCIAFFVARPLGNQPMRSRWRDNLDAFVFTPTSVPSTRITGPRK